jgi:DHA2 family multidrug resistance protein-like MFS transporter
LLALNLGGGAAPALVAAGLALVAGLCSLARLNPSLRKPAGEEVVASQPGAQVR